MPNAPNRPHANTGHAADEIPSADLLAQTISVWQPHFHRPLTSEDARQIVENVSGFFEVLLEWDRKRGGTNGGGTPA
ncbi:MAG TPA: hypothetical protein VN428_03725 [Bryobacteraceae bacterium]|nr:hypothetical protein [Bryobacteraceae bacterium]